MTAWYHAVKGRIEGELIWDGGEWVQIRLDRAQELRSAKPGKTIPLPEDEVITVRKSRLREIPEPKEN